MVVSFHIVQNAVLYMPITHQRQADLCEKDCNMEAHFIHYSILKP